MTASMTTVAVPETLTAASLARFRAALGEGSATARGGPLVLRGGADMWCTGLSLDAIDGDLQANAAMDSLLDVLRRLRAHEGATVALVEGRAAGGGTGIAAACDVVVAVRGARFSLPEALFGLTPATVAPFVVARIGPARARAMMLDGEARDADWALGSGLADLVVDLHEIEGALARLSRRLRRADGGAVLGVRRLTSPPDLEAALETGRGETLRRLADPDVRARIRRFNAGQAPWQ